MKKSSIHSECSEIAPTDVDYPVISGENLVTMAGLYRFCAQSMKFPEECWFNQDYLPCLYQLLENIGGFHQKRELEQALALSYPSLDSLQIEYTRLFINGSPHVLAPPYASVYLDKSLQGQSTAKILSFYYSQGFFLREGEDLPDHIVNQLGFLAHLVEAGDHACEAQFLSRLFHPWFQLFFPRVVCESQHPFYRIIVQIIDYFTKEEDENGIQGIEA